MEEVTDAPFRKICKEFGADVLISEFVASDAIVRKIAKSLKKFEFEEIERPLGIQIFGNNAQIVCEAALIAEEFHPDFIDLNYGCPVSKVCAKGSGAGMLRTPELMMEITRAVCKAVKIPVTAKTRLGWDDKSKVIADLAEGLQDCGIAALSIHGRTKTQMYKGEAEWALIGEVASNPRITIPVIGNGDIDSAYRAGEMRKRYPVDGLMIGRASIGNPWIFREIRHYLNTGNMLMPPKIKERTEVCRRHLLAEIEWKGERRGVGEMRKHYSGYFKAIPDFKAYRLRLMALSDTASAMALYDEISKL